MRSFKDRCWDLRVLSKKHQGLIREECKYKKKLDSIPRVDELKVDGHAHIYTNYRPQANRWYLEPGRRDLEWLTNLVLRRGINGLGITNFNDSNYEFWTSQNQVESLPPGWRYYQDDRLTVIETSEQRRVYYWKSEEVATKEGHILFWGGKRGKEKNVRHGRSLAETLDEADSDLCKTKIADHPYSLHHGLKERLKRSAERIDAYEWNASADGNKKTEEEAKKYEKPVVAQTDSHRPSEIGKSYTQFKGQDLKYDNGEEFMKSIKENVKKKKFDVKKRRCCIFSNIHHVIMNIVYHVLYKLGWKSLID